MLERILYANSGAGTTQEMLKVLLDLPAISRANLTILHVVPPQVTSDAFAQKWEEGGKVLAEIIPKLNLNPNKVTTMLRQGEPKDTVRQVAEEIQTDLIIMGSRGLKRLEAILSNSISQYVFQLTNHPLLLVKEDIYIKRIKRVMVAMDKSAASQYAFDLALHLLRDYQEAELILTRINPDLAPELLPLSKTEMDNNPILAPAAAKAKRMGVKSRCIVTGGKPAQQICQLADDYNADLLMIGSPDRRPSVAKSLPDLDRLLGTSLSDYVRVNASCPVLLARTND